MTISLKPPLPSHTSFILTDLCAHQSRCNQEGSYFRREHAEANSLWNLRKINQFQATRIDVENAWKGNLLVNRILRTLKPCESTRLGTLWCAHTNDLNMRISVAIYQYMICVESWNKPQPTVLAWDMGMERRNKPLLSSSTYNLRQTPNYVPIWFSCILFNFSSISNWLSWTKTAAHNPSKPLYHGPVMWLEDACLKLTRTHLACLLELLGTHHKKHNAKHNAWFYGLHLVQHGSACRTGWTKTHIGLFSQVMSFSLNDEHCCPWSLIVQ